MAKSTIAFKQSEAQRRNDEKCKLLDRHSTSEDLFQALIQEINTLANDESSHDFSVGDDYNYGTDYEIELLLDLIGDLRLFTRYIKDEDDKSINSFNLNYLRPYF